MRVTSAVPSPTAAAGLARRFVFTFIDSPRREVALQRRLAVADYIDGLPSVWIVSECADAHARRCRVTLHAARPLTLDAVRDYLADCPHVVRGAVEIASQ